MSSELPEPAGSKMNDLMADDPTDGKEPAQVTRARSGSANPMVTPEESIAVATPDTAIPEEHTAAANTHPSISQASPLQTIEVTAPDTARLSGVRGHIALNAPGMPGAASAAVASNVTPPGHIAPEYQPHAVHQVAVAPAAAASATTHAETTAPAQLQQNHPVTSTQSYPQSYPAQSYPAQPANAAYSGQMGIPQPLNPSQVINPVQPVWNYQHQAPPKKRSDRRRYGVGSIIVAVVVSAVLGGGAAAGINLIVRPNNTHVAGDTNGSSNIVINNPENVNTIAAVAAKSSSSVVTLNVTGSNSGGTGSGVVMSKDGYVVTNTHVVTLDGETSAVKIQAKTSDGKIYSAKVVGTDPLLDLAVVKLDATDLNPIVFADSGKLNVGDLTIAIGAARGLDGTVTSGIVSAVNRSIAVNSSAAPATPDDNGSRGQNPPGQGDYNFSLPNPNGGLGTAKSQIYLPVVQTDAAINPGNSGGALLNSAGQLIGLNSAILSTGGSSSEAGNIGVGFAVPSNLVNRVAQEIIKTGKATHGLLGATVGSAEASGANIVGALIKTVVAQGAAEKAGLKNGDVVTHLGETVITSQPDLTAQVRALAGGAITTISFVRDGQTKTVEVTLGTYTDQ